MFFCYICKTHIWCPSILTGPPNIAGFYGEGYQLYDVGKISGGLGKQIAQLVIAKGGLELAVQCASENMSY